MSPRTKKELQAFLGIINYLSEFSPSMADICESLRKLTLAGTKWNWDAKYQNIFDRAKSIIKEDACLNFIRKPSHYSQKQMHLELDRKLPCYKQEVVQVAPGMKHHTTAYSDPLHSQARACQAWKKDTAT